MTTVTSNEQNRRVMWRERIVPEPSRTFGEFLLLPNLTRRECTPQNVLLRTPIVKHKRGETAAIELNIPFVSSMMQSVSDHRLSIALARQGGMSFIYSSQSIDQQAAMVRAVKRHKAGFVVSDSNVAPTDTVGEVMQLSRRTGHSTIAVTDDGSPTGKLLGIVTDRDYRPGKCDPDTPVSKVMTPYADLVCGPRGMSIEDANELIWKHRINCLPVVAEDQHLAFLVFRKDYDDHKRHQSELLDTQKRLMVGAAVNTHDYRDRIPSLVEAGADVLCVDSSDGYSEWQSDTIAFIRERFGDSVKVGGGNVVHRDAFLYLVEAGADFVKIGTGGGAICITREQKGIGRGQATSVMDVAAQRDEYFDETGIYVPICSDGAISQDYHIALALAMGADFVMMGRYFARFEESPSRMVKLGGATVKEYWGEGTSRANNWERYSEGGSRRLLFEEGVDAYVPYAGKLADNLESTLGKLRSVMCNCGSISLREFRESARFVLVTQPTIREGGVHDVIMKATDVE